MGSTTVGAAAGASAPRVRPAAQTPASASSTAGVARQGADLSDLCNDTGAVAYFVDGYPGSLQHGQQHVRKRRALREIEVLSALHPSAGLAEQARGQRILIVRIAVAHVAAVEEQ